MAKDDAKKDGETKAEKPAKPAKPAKSKAEKAKKAKQGAKPAAGGSLPSVAAHPRAGAQVARAKAWGGLAGFSLTALLSWRAGVPVPDLLLRATAAGIAGYVVTWACAVAVWRHLVIAELRAVRVQRAALAAARAEAAPVATAEAAPIA
jgi:hypothetical protein